MLQLLNKGSIINTGYSGNHVSHSIGFSDSAFVDTFNDGERHFTVDRNRRLGDELLRNSEPIPELDRTSDRSLERTKFGFGAASDGHVFGVRAVVVVSPKTFILKKNLSVTFHSQCFCPENKTKIEFNISLPL
jgi:hypothetical protein